MRAIRVRAKPESDPPDSCERQKATAIGDRRRNNGLQLEMGQRVTES